MTRISLHNITEIKVSKVKKSETEEGRIFFVRDFDFIDDEGHKTNLTVFSNYEENLKSK